MKQTKEDLLKERTDNKSHSQRETAILNEKLVDLEKRLQEEKGKYKVLEEKSEQNKVIESVGGCLIVGIDSRGKEVK